jgi:hypothetical protein
MPLLLQSVSQGISRIAGWTLCFPLINYRVALCRMWPISTGQHFTCDQATCGLARPPSSGFLVDWPRNATSFHSLDKVDKHRPFILQHEPGFQRATHNRIRHRHVARYVS